MSTERYKQIVSVSIIWNRGSHTTGQEGKGSTHILNSHTTTTTTSNADNNNDDDDNYGNDDDNNDNNKQQQQ